MYYPIRKEDVTTENFGNQRTYRLKGSPGRTNMSKQPKREGWLGTTNDISAYALGEYETREAAIEAIREDCPDGHKLLHRDSELKAERWISRPDVSQEETNLIEEEDIKTATMLGPYMEAINDLYREHGCPKMQYEGAYDTTTGSSYDPSDFLTTMEGVDPYGEEPERSKKIVATYNAEMETIMAALNLEYPRYYTTPEWDAFRHEAIEWLADHKQEMKETVIEVQTPGGAVV